MGWPNRNNSEPWGMTPDSDDNVESKEGFFQRMKAYFGPLAAKAWPATRDWKNRSITKAFLSSLVWALFAGGSASHYGRIRYRRPKIFPLRQFPPRCHKGMMRGSTAQWPFCSLTPVALIMRRVLLSPSPGQYAVILRLKGCASPFQSLNSPTTETLFTWGAQTRKLVDPSKGIAPIPRGLYIEDFMRSTIERYVDLPPARAHPRLCRRHPQWEESAHYAFPGVESQSDQAARLFSSAYK